MQRGGFNGNRTVEVQVTNRVEGQGWAYRTGANSPSQQIVESSQQIYDLRTQNETFRIQNQDMQSLKDANETLLRKLASKDQLLQAMESQMSNLLTEKSSMGSLILSQEKQMANLQDLISQKDREIHALATRFGENDQKNQMLLDKLKEFQQTQPSPTSGNLESMPEGSLNTNRDLETPTAKPIQNFDAVNGNKTNLGLILQDQKFLAAIVEEIKKKLIKMFGANFTQKFDLPVGGTNNGNAGYGDDVDSTERNVICERKELNYLEVEGSVTEGYRNFEKRAGETKIHNDFCRQPGGGRDQDLFSVLKVYLPILET